VKGWKKIFHAKGSKEKRKKAEYRYRVELYTARKLYNGKWLSRQR